jgi:hypothetical protein
MAAAVPAALLMAAGGAQVAYASPPGVASAAGAISKASAAETYYTMRLSPSSVTLRPGSTARIIISFNAPRGLYGTPVDMSVSGLPSGVSASFSPSTTVIGGFSVLTVTAAPSSTAGAFAATVMALTESSDPIGTTATLGVTVG